jgi:hypothetical protein
MVELRGLKIKRGQFKTAQLRQFNNFIEGDADDDQEIKKRFDKIVEIWDKFQNIQYAIKETLKQTIPHNKEEGQLERIERKEDEEIAFENSYFRLVAYAKRRLRQLNQSNEVTTIAETDATSAAKSSVKLPTITLLSHLMGNIVNGCNSKMHFLSLIDRNPALSEIQKLQYLRGILKNETLQFIEGLETTTENYSTAWKLLSNHYENRRLIISTYLKELFETASITKGNKMVVRQFVNHIRMYVKALATLKLPVDQWDAILIYLATNKLDYYTRKEWETHIGNG